MTAPEVPSPCVQICQLDERQICTGCGRTLSEIAEWPQAAVPRKQQISDAARQRREQMVADGQHPA